MFLVAHVNRITERCVSGRWQWARPRVGVSPLTCCVHKLVLLLRVLDALLATELDESGAGPIDLPERRPIRASGEAAAVTSAAVTANQRPARPQELAVKLPGCPEQQE